MELTYQTHVVAPFLLTQLLLPLMGEGSSVITVSSGGMYLQGLRPDQLRHGPAPYDGVRAYAMAKRAQVVLNGEWARRLDSPMFHAMHPGWADTPGVAHSLPGFHRIVGPWLRSPEQGADTIVWLASNPEGLGPSGRFWLDRRQRGTIRLPWTATSTETSQELWDMVARDAGVSAPSR